MLRPKFPALNSRRATLILTGLCAALASADFAFANDAATPVRGVVRPAARAMISTDLQAQVSATKFKEGDPFKKGDVLIEFNCRRHEAELAAAEAQMLEMKLLLNNNVELDKLKAVGRTDVEVSRARLKKAEAEANGLRARIEQCRVVAPFDGRISELGIEAFEMPQAGKPFLTIIEDRKLEIELIVPSDWLKWVKAGTAFTFAVDETKGSYSARVTRIGAEVDAVSQTIKVMGVFDGDTPPDGILSGMSGNAGFVEAKG